MPLFANLNPLRAEHLVPQAAQLQYISLNWQVVPFFQQPSIEHRTQSRSHICMLLTPPPSWQLQILLGPCGAVSTQSRLTLAGSQESGMVTTPVALLDSTGVQESPWLTWWGVERAPLYPPGVSIKAPTRVSFLFSHHKEKPKLNH